jgi:hypothetical protein
MRFAVSPQPHLRKPRRLDQAFANLQQEILGVGSRSPLGLLGFSNCKP